MKRSGTADLPLHGGRVPAWLADRMTALGIAISEAILLRYGHSELLSRLSDPFWFQALGCVMGMDWHSSGITTSVLGALKRGLNPRSRELGIYICGGRGRHSRGTPNELRAIADASGLDGDMLVRTSRLTARVDNNAIADGFQIYLHSFVLTANGEWAVVQQGMNEATPRRLTTSPDSVHGIAWTADSAALVVDSGPAVAPANLWRIGVIPAGPPKELPFGRGGGRRSDPAAQDGSTVAIARTGNRLVYCRAVQNVNLWSLPLAAPATPAGMPARFLPSTRVEINPAYSPDGKRVVFHSTRSGKPGLWVGDVSGGNAAELFVPQRGHAGSPSWSPDGQTIVFDWNDAGRFQIYGIRASGGKPHRLTNDPASDTIPNWSGDGKWIYFTSTRSGRAEIWKIPASGGAAVQVTRNSGMLPRESPDGRFVYYLKNGGSGGIWRTALTGQGDEMQIVPSIYRGHFALSARGIYFVSTAGEDGKHALSYVPFEGGKPKAILTLPRVPVMGLAVSPDGGSLLYSQVEQISQELALVENFK